MPVQLVSCPIHDCNQIVATSMEVRSSPASFQGSPQCNGVNALYEKVSDDDDASGHGELASDSIVDERHQMSVVDEENRLDSFCYSNDTKLETKEAQTTEICEHEGLVSEDLELNAPKQEKSEDVPEILEETLLDDQGNNFSKDGSSELIENELSCSLQNPSPKADREPDLSAKVLLDAKVHLSGVDSLNAVQVEGDKKQRKTSGFTNGLTTLAPGRNQKPRTSRSTNGGKNSTWGTSDGLQSIIRKGLDGDASKKLMEPQRSYRQARKRKQDDMAYEGDLEWEALMAEPEATTDINGINDKDRMGKSRAKAALGSLLFAQVFTGESGESAAVAAGLRARAPGPAERIRFKDVLKRRGGLQEYLECRNLILGLWERDVRHILSITDCGVSATPLSDETPRASLIREIYDFLNYHGYINMGVAMKKLKSKGEARSVRTKVEKPPAEGSHQEREKERVKFAEADEEAAIILGQIRGVEETETGLHKPSPPSCENQGQLEKPEGPLNGDLDSPNGRKRGLEQGLGLMRPAKKGSGKGEVVSMKIEEGPLLRVGGNQSSEVVCLEGYIDLKGNKPSPTGALDMQVDAKDSGDQLKDFSQEELEGVEQKKCSGEVDEFNDLDSAKILHNLRHTDLKPDKLCVPNVHKTDSAMDSVNFDQQNLERQKRIIVVGAGPAGLAAAKHLQRMNFGVILLEARQRLGGRVYTDHSTFSGPVDLGASIITGVEADVATERRPDPSALLCKQLDLELTTLRGECPLYDSVSGVKVPADIDGALEAEYNSLLDDTIMLVAQNGDVAMRMSLEEGLEHALKRRRANRVLHQRLSDSHSLGGLSGKVAEHGSLNKQEGVLFCAPLEDGQGVGLSDPIMQSSANAFSSEGMLAVADTDLKCRDSRDSEQVEHENLSQPERRVMDWHFANLEYGCAAELKNISLPYWNQDDVYGGFGGPHCMIKGGYSTVMQALGEGLNVQLGQVVTTIDYSCKDAKNKVEFRKEIKVRTEKGEEFIGDAVLVTVPLGCLKANKICFSPHLPDWKTDSIERLGFGVLNKVVLEFPSAFWDETVDYFGATAERTELRGRCFMFWNLKRTVGAPILIALVVGKAAVEGEKRQSSELVGHAVSILRKLFGESAVPEPIASAVTDWGNDPFSRGAYSYVAVGASGEDYDILGRPVDNCLFFAGEATCKEHPDTVGGAMMSGLREAVRIIDILENRGDSTAEAEAMAVAQRQSDSERNEVRDMVKRLAAAEISNAIWNDGGKSDGDEQPLSRAALLQDMCGGAKTTAGRLLLAKEMLQLPAPSVKAFAGTKDGLTVLNSWILDSMGKDGTQLLRHCVRLLLVVATDLLSVRQSGVGRTVKEKVFVHTSRDIRAVASQLVKMWVEVFRKEKAVNGPVKPGPVKPLKQSSGALSHQGLINASKAKPKEQTSGKASPTVTGAATVVLKDNVSPTSNGDCTPASPSLQKLTVVSENAQVIRSIEMESRDASSREGEDGEKKADPVQNDEPISETEAAALAAAKAARAAALAAAEAYATAEAAKTVQPELPKILSFHKFAKREHLATREESKRRKSLETENFVLHSKQNFSSGVDSRNCKVRNWSIDFSTSCNYLGSPSLLAVSDVGATSRDGMSLGASSLSELPNICTGKLREETNSIPSPKPEKGWMEIGAFATRVKEAEHRHTGVPMIDALLRRGPTTTASGSPTREPSVKDHKANIVLPDTSINSQIEISQGNGDSVIGLRKWSPGSLEGCKENCKGPEQIKKAVSEYVVQLLTPLYKTRKIEKDGFKSIVKKSTIKVMERSSEQEISMEVSKFLDIKRKIKIRSLVDKFVEKYMEGTQR